MAYTVHCNECANAEAKWKFDAPPVQGERTALAHEAGLSSSKVFSESTKEVS